MRYILLLVLALGFTSVMAQSKTTESLHKKYSDALSLFFYNNTLRMLNQEESKEFDDLIKDIEKMKFLVIKKEGTNSITPAEIKKLSTDYRSEAFEEMMTARHEGKNFNVYMKEKNGKTEGVVVLVNDSTQFMVMDMVGSIELSKVSSFINSIDRNSEIGKKIKAFSDKALD
ncbi:MAG TPA: DUF4252 domain-containing protein [Ohtaekwangia sp.]